MLSSAMPKAGSDEPHGSLLESNASWGPPDAADATTFFLFNSCIISFNGLELGFEDWSSLISGKYLEVWMLPAADLIPKFPFEFKFKLPVVKLIFNDPVRFSRVYVKKIDFRIFLDLLMRDLNVSLSFHNLAMAWEFWIILWWRFQRGIIQAVVLLWCGRGCSEGGTSHSFQDIFFIPCTLQVIG